MAEQDTLPRVQFRLDTDLHSNLLDRAKTEAGLTEIARRDLVRYYDLMAQTLKRIGEEKRFLWTETFCLFEAARDVPWIRGGSSRLLDSVTEAIWMEELDKKWGITGETLISKLGALTELEQLALLDRVERFWALSKYQRSLTVGFWIRDGILAQNMMEMALRAYDCWGDRTKLVKEEEQKPASLWPQVVIRARED